MLTRVVWSREVAALVKARYGDISTNTFASVSPYTSSSHAHVNPNGVNTTS